LQAGLLFKYLAHFFGLQFQFDFFLTEATMLRVLPNQNPAAWLLWAIFQDLSPIS